ncbi:Density-regulated protein, putative [Entamoeba invadens IP1]|uniref:Density-regulated protein, putative n=1 Tax=Entamoeba invadens IP1 TaxID=370355 RepID=UPI0002C3D35B|nr:Density-regulated protein, putative [Entamoeba invadens IP1]ELP93131.1 Density-regulated protein, putative [Entamoeba invadens IP1]|eukprot:XP_004259902.1 Density-regulated protein, putative [Entamoeba invadens IP1]
MATETIAPTTEIPEVVEDKAYTKIVFELCPFCHIPKEYCEFGPNAKKCKKAQAETEEQAKEVPKEEEPKQEGAVETTPTEAKEPEKEEQKEVKKEQAKKKATHNTIKITNVKRNKKQSVTKISGVKAFGLKQQDVSKFISKKFSVGAAIDKTQNIDCINIQGDFVREVADILHDQFKIDLDNIEY